jgi:hypothetical protein
MEGKADLLLKRSFEPRKGLRYTCHSEIDFEVAAIVVEEVGSSSNRCYEM